MSEKFYADAALYDRLFPGGEQAAALQVYVCEPA
jgi:hypothetical protein